MSKDYYNILGVDKNAPAAEIKKSYYKLAHQHHPHKGGDEAKMKEINEAYSVLSNAEKRAQYDQYGQTFEQARSQGGFGGFGNPADFAQAFRGGGGNNSYSFEFGDLGDIFSDLFGGGGTRTRARTQTHQGLDIEAELTLDFQEAVFGAEKTLKMNKDAVCEKCKGDGAEPGSKVTTCSTCKGRGQVVRTIGFGIGIPSVCPDCEGQGKKVEKKCSQCRGRGAVKQTEDIKVNIPAGIDNGQSIRLVGKGNAGTKGGENGDLYLRIKVLPDFRFRRDGFDVRSKTEISFSQAALGDKIEIETLDGKVKLKIPEGTQSGKVFQLKGRGIPHLQGRGRGDQLVEVAVKTPTRLNRKQKDLLREFGEGL